MIKKKGNVVTIIELEKILIKPDIFARVERIKFFKKCFCIKRKEDSQEHLKI